MAATTVESQVITDFENKLYSEFDHKFRYKTVKSVLTLEVATTSIDEVGDKIMMAPLRSDARVIGLWFMCGDLDTNGTPLLTIDVGLYTTANAIVDVDAYASAVTTFQAEVTDPVNLAFEARDVALAGQAVWQDAGASTDPGGYYYLGLNTAAAAATAAAETITLIIEELTV